MAEDKNTFIFSHKDLMVRSFSKFCDMKTNGEFSDVSIRTGSHVFTAHRIILAAGIPYFHAMFTSNLAESEAKEVTIKELDPDALESLIDFAYTSNVIITTKNVQSLLVVSQFLQLTQVRDSCCEFISERLDPNNVMEVRALAESQNCLSLVENSDCYIRQNFDSFCQSEDFLSLSFSFLKELINRDDLHVKSEETVFDAVLTWTKDDTERYSFLPELLTGIRMTYLSIQFLIKTASTEKLIQESSLCRSILDEAKHYHLLPEERPSCSFPLSKRCYIEHDNIYLFCSNNSTGLTIFKYSPETQKLSTLLYDSTRKDIQHVVALGDIIYAFRSNSFESFNPVTLQWTSLANFVSRDVLFIYAVPCCNKIYCLVNDSSESQFSIFDPHENQWVNLVQYVQMDEAVLVSSGPVIYILDNGCSLLSNYTNKMYNPVTGKFDIFASKNTNSYSSAGASLENKIYVCGGTPRPQRGIIFGAPAQGVALTSCEMYNPATAQWLPVSPMTLGRKNFSLVSCKKKLYAIGGTTSDGLLCNVIESYDPETDKWTTAGEISGNYDCTHAVGISTTDT